MSESAYEIGDAEFELRADGKVYKGTARASMHFSREYVRSGDWSESLGTSQEVSIDLKNVGPYTVTFENEEKKFFIDNLPEAPFDYHWEIHPEYDESTIRHYGDRPDEFKRTLSWQRWTLKMVASSADAAIEIRYTIIDGLDDETIIAAAEHLVQKHIVANRILALKSGAVKLIGHDDAQ